LWIILPDNQDMKLGDCVAKKELTWNFNQSWNKRELPNPQRLPFWKRIYLPEIFRGMGVMLKMFFSKKFTTPYPEEKLPLYPRFRGEHRLIRDEKGRIRCVACFMCSTACPSQCITIVAGPAPKEYGPDRDKYPVRYEINELRCIFCGMCEEACPKQAVELIQKIPRPYYTRQEFIYDRSKLLNNKEDEQAIPLDQKDYL